MKIRADQTALAEQFRRLAAEANPALQRFRGLGTSPAVQKAAQAQEPAQGASSTASPRPAPPPANAAGSPAPSPNAPRPNGAHGVPLGLPANAANAKAELLFRAFGAPTGSLPEAGLGLSQNPMVGRKPNGLEQPELPRDAQASARSQQLSPGGQAPRGELARAADPRAAMARPEARLSLEQFARATLPQAASSRPEISQAKTFPKLEPGQPRERLPPLDLSRDEPQSASEVRVRGEPRIARERTEARVATAGELERPAELERSELRAGVELKARLETTLKTEEQVRLDHALPFRIDAHSAAELQTLIALHAKTGAPFATALAELRAMPNKSAKKPVKPGPTHDERVRTARKARLRAYAVVAVIAGLFLVFTLASSCSG